MAYYRKRGNAWELRISYKDPFTQKNKVKSQGGFKTKKEAQLAAADLEKQLNEGLHITEERLKTYLHYWLHDYKKDTIRKNTFEIHRNNIEKHITPYFKEIKLVDLIAEMYQAFLNQLTEKGYSKRTIEIIHGTFYSAMQRALVMGKIQRNPCQDASIKGEKKVKKIEYIDSEEIPSFLSTAYDYGYIYWMFFKISIETGMRKGEVGGLTWSDINLEDQTITITKTLDYTQPVSADKDTLLGDPKTYHSMRTISISRTLCQDLKMHLQLQNQNKLIFKENYRHDLQLVNARKDGTFIPKSSLFNAFSRILKRANIERIPIHGLRHTHAVLLLESGVSMKYIQERLGHGSMQITADIYSHISKKLEKNNMDKFESFTKGILD